MAMQIGAEGDEDDVVSAINTTPLVDVMLVLLIIFLITIPVVTHTIPVQLPKESNIARQTKPENIDISINKDVDIFWNQQLVPDTDALFQRLSKVATMKPQPEVHIRGDGQARYESVGRVLFQCTRAGMPVSRRRSGKSGLSLSDSARRVSHAAPGDSTSTGSPTGCPSSSSRSVGARPSPASATYTPANSSGVSSMPPTAADRP